MARAGRTCPRDHVPEREEGFTSALIETAQYLGWRVVHFRPARTSKGWRTLTQGSPGWPDVVLAKPPILIVAELKSARGQLSAEQEAWREVLRQCPGISYVVWRPADWPMIVKVLEEGR